MTISGNPIAIRLEQSLLDQADELAVRLQETPLTDFTGTTISRSAVLRRAVRLGLQAMKTQTENEGKTND